MKTQSQRFFRGTEQFGRAFDTVKRAIFKGDVRKRPVAAPNLPEGKPHDLIGIVEGTMTQGDVSRRLSQVGPVIAVIQKDGETVVPASAGVLSSVPLFLHGKRKPMPVSGRGKAFAVLHQHVGAAETKHTAGRIEETAANRHADVVKSGDAIIPGAENAILHQNSVATADVKPIVPA